MIVGQIFETKNYGMLEVVEITSHDNVKVRFIDTGFLRNCQKSKIIKGSVKDFTKRNTHGVGFYGYPRERVSRSKYKQEIYGRWRCMISRCYNRKDKAYGRYGALGVTVCDEWHNFQNFAIWFLDNYPSDGKVWHIDKDKLSSGKKIYSPSHCSFVSPEVNTSQSTSKTYLMKSPSGELIEINNMSEFCSDKGLTPSAMSSVHRGKRKSHKGWTV